MTVSLSQQLSRQGSNYQEEGQRVLHSLLHIKTRDAGPGILRPELALPGTGPETGPLKQQLPAQGSKYQEEGQRVLQRFHDWLQSGAPDHWRMEADNEEGWRVAVDEGEGQWGWALLRASLHDPLLVLNVESENAGAPLSSLLI